MWINKLQKTYLSYPELIGKVNDSGAPPVCPPYHTTMTTEIEIVISMDGNFVSAQALEKSERGTIVQCTEVSESRTNMPSPMGLTDRLKYLAGDHPEAEKFHSEYMAALTDWCGSSFGLPEVRAVAKYLRKGCLISDLVHAGLLRQEAGKIADKWDKEWGPKPTLYALTYSPLKTAARFCVVSKSGEVINLSHAKNVQESWITYQNSKADDVGLCYATGEIGQLSRFSPNKIRYPSDRAKLISRGGEDIGRMPIADAMQVGKEANDQAHAMLRYLVSEYGSDNDGQIVLAWNVSGKQLPPCLVTSSTKKICESAGISQLEDITGLYDRDGESAVIVLNAPTKGRLSITYYREMTTGALLDRVVDWHRKLSRGPACNAPGIDAIAKMDNAGSQRTTDILVGCLVDGLPIPTTFSKRFADLAESKIQQGKGDWETFVACAVMRGTGEKVDPSGRDYVFGRCLGVCKNAEKHIHSTCIADSLHRQYRQSPARTLAQLCQQLSQQLPARWDKRIEAALDGIGVDDYNNTPISPAYLIGYKDAIDGV